MTLRSAHNLTLNLGLRYEYYSPLVDVHNQQSNFNYATGQLFRRRGRIQLPAELSPTEVGCAQGNSNALATSQKTNFAPRVGLAYTPFGKTVIRGSLWHLLHRAGGSDRRAYQLQYNLPYYYQPTFTSNGVHPLITLATGFPGAESGTGN